MHPSSPSLKNERLALKSKRLVACMILAGVTLVSRWSHFLASVQRVQPQLLFYHEGVKEDGTTWPTLTPTQSPKHPLVVAHEGVIENGTARTTLTPTQSPKHPLVVAHEGVIENGTARTTLTPTQSPKHPFVVAHEGVMDGKAWPFRSFDNITDSKNRLILLIVNCPYVDFLDNALESMKAFDIHNVVVVPLDEKAYNYTVKLLPAYQVTPVPLFLVGDIDSSNAARFKTKEFQRLTSSRPALIELFLNMGHTVFYHDLDIFWKRNIFEYFDKADAEHNNTLDLVAMVDQGKIRGNNLCTCYLYMHPTDTVKNFLTSWKASIDTGKYRHDQDAAIAAYRAFPPERFNAVVLGDNNEYFPSGMKYARRVKRNKTGGVWMIHNNWIKGHANKRNRFIKQWDAWTPSKAFQELDWQCTNSTT